MDPMTQAMLATLHVEDLLRESQLRHPTGASWLSADDPRAVSPPARPHLPMRLRRRLAALLIQAGRRLAGDPRQRSYPLYDSAYRSWVKVQLTEYRGGRDPHPTHPHRGGGLGGGR